MPTESSRRDETELVAALKAGEESAYEQFVRELTPRLLAVARRLLPKEADAQDAVQDAFLQAFKSLDRFEGGSKLSTWMHRIVVNAALMKLRTRRRKPEVAIDDLLPRFGDDAEAHHVEPVADWRESAVEEATRSETRELIHAAIDRLPEDYRTVLVLRDIEQLDTAETAEHLDVTKSVVKTRLHRARQALRTLLDPHFRETPA